MEPDDFLMRQAEKQGRFRAMAISGNDLMNLFNWAQGELLQIPVGQGDLSGALCVGVYDDPTWRGLLFVFCSPKFDPVPSGMEIPRFPFRSVDWRLLNASIVAKGYVDAEAKQPGSGSHPAPPSERELEAATPVEKPGWPYA